MIITGTGIPAGLGAGLGAGTGTGRAKKPQGGPCYSLLYTGDYSREEDRHLIKAEIPPVHPDVLLVESTYGVQSLEGREEKELRFTNLSPTTIAPRDFGHDDLELPSFFSSLVRLDTIRYIVNCRDLIPFTKK